MRLDKFLKVSRLIKRRTVANEACDAGRVLVNDKPAKASVKVKPGDIIEIQFGTRTVKVEVLDIKDTSDQRCITWIFCVGDQAASCTGKFHLYQLSQPFLYLQDAMFVFELLAIQPKLHPLELSVEL